MQGKCKICGCTENNACIHPDGGPCWWINRKHDLCSYCNPEFKNDKSIERPADRKKNISKTKISIIKKKVKKRTSTFAERNILKIIEKKQKKANQNPNTKIINKINK